MTKWDVYFASLVAMTLHPGFQREGAKVPSLSEIWQLCDKMEAISNARNIRNVRDDGDKRDRSRKGKRAKCKERVASDKVSGKDVEYGVSAESC